MVVSCILPNRSFFRNVFLILLALMIPAVPLASRADYPLVSHKFAADPTGLEYNGRIYLYCSNDTDNNTNGGYTMHFNYWQFNAPTNVPSPISLVKFEAESGVLGSDFAVSNSGSPAYITVTSDDVGNNPASSNRVATR
jgi:hypothetical protein